MKAWVAKAGNRYYNGSWFSYGLNSARLYDTLSNARRSLWEDGLRGGKIVRVEITLIKRNKK